MKKLVSLKNPLFNTLETKEMKAIVGGVGNTWTLQEIIVTYKKSTGEHDTAQGEPAHWDTGDAAQP